MHRSATDFGIAMAGVCGMIFSSVAGSETHATPTLHDTRSPMVANADEYLATLARMQPEFGTSEDLPGTDHGALTDNTEAGIARWRAYEDKVLAQLGAQFDLRAFHDQVLGRGSVTLPLLRELVEEWIATTPALAPRTH